jgi:hypothetical protein
MPLVANKGRPFMNSSLVSGTSVSRGSSQRFVFRTGVIVISKAAHNVSAVNFRY